MENLHEGYRAAELAGPLGSSNQPRPTLPRSARAPLRKPPRCKPPRSQWGAAAEIGC